AYAAHVERIERRGGAHRIPGDLEQLGGPRELECVLQGRGQIQRGPHIDRVALDGLDRIAKRRMLAHPCAVPLQAPYLCNGLAERVDVPAVAQRSSARLQLEQPS